MDNFTDIFSLVRILTLIKTPIQKASNLYPFLRIAGHSSVMCVKSLDIVKLTKQSFSELPKALLRVHLHTSKLISQLSTLQLYCVIQKYIQGTNIEPALWNELVRFQQIVGFLYQVFQAVQLYKQPLQILFFVVLVCILFMFKSTYYRQFSGSRQAVVLQSSLSRQAQNKFN